MSLKTLTVKQLIDKLQLIENKDLPVYIDIIDYEEIFPINDVQEKPFNQDEVLIPIVFRRL